MKVSYHIIILYSHGLCVSVCNSVCVCVCVRVCVYIVDKTASSRIITYT